MIPQERTERFLNDDDWEVLVKVCAEVGVAPDIVERMLIEESKVYAMGRRHGVRKSLEDLVDEGVTRTTDAPGGREFK